MAQEILRWLGDERLLNELAAGLPSLVLVALMALCVLALSKGADWMIDGVVQLARRTGLPRIVIGATIVSLGTTAPEMFVSVMAAWMGNPGLALGNGVGSIICDTGMIFGLSCLLVAMPMNRYILNRTGWVQVGSATLLVLISLIALGTMEGPPVLMRWVGGVFLFLLIGYLFLSYLWARRGAQIFETSDESRPMGLGRSSWLIGSGLVVVIAASRVLIPCAGELARRMGVPDDVIAATLVALGTSLPELMTAIAAIRKGRPEITIGNIVGADVLNSLFVIGAAAAARPLEIPPNFFHFHYPAMILILYSFRVFIFMNRNGRFRRWQGGWLFGIYLLYLILQYALNLGGGSG